MEKCPSTKNNTLCVELSGQVHALFFPSLLPSLLPGIVCALMRPVLLPLVSHSSTSFLPGVCQHLLMAGAPRIPRDLLYEKSRSFSLCDICLKPGSKRTWVSREISKYGKMSKHQEQHTLRRALDQGTPFHSRPLTSSRFLPPQVYSQHGCNPSLSNGC